MKYTNTTGLPESVASAMIAIDQDYQKKSDFSASDFVRPIRQFVLMERYEAELEEDVSDMMFKVIGSALHSILERGITDADVISEKRYHRNVDISEGTFSVSGQPDRYYPDSAAIWEYKTAAVWKWLGPMSENREEALHDWEVQMNVYAWLLRLHGIPVYELRVMAIFRDYRNGEALSKIGYPRPAEPVSLKLWTQDQADLFVRVKIANIILARRGDDYLPECSDIQVWRQPSFWAVKGRWRKNALVGASKFTTNKDAQAFIDSDFPQGHPRRDKVYIEFRQGGPRRCEKYCLVSKFCKQYQNEKKQTERIKNEQKNK